ncbi:MAG: hypothetical protein QN141_03735 [Armatimonadota bacterium]|nr:hypothetical protein [Armatimonadota bacterium]MDR7451456.1 hypothetical protein [Armatimonadota bacterium]MDR7466394.1 hypothetical protein [Armatimonadota bacterium]MDR7493116.1 hypothetical protein [Armatimonadota bacterium]MDR7498127.1 hypothetical protein [Armatimonadota bacterium]
MPAPPGPAYGGAGARNPGGVPIVEEWLAWYLVRERERQLQRQELIREAARQQQRRGAVIGPLRPRQSDATEGVHRDRRAA